MSASTLSVPNPRRESHKRTRDPLMISLWIALFIVALIWLVPIIFMIFTAFKSSAELYTGSPFLPPQNWYFENFMQAWTRGKIGRYAINSLIISFTKVPLGILVASLAAFAFARLRFRYQKTLLMLIVMGTMIPVQVALGPIFTLILNTGLLSTWLGIVLPYIAFGLPYHIFLFNSFFKNLPRELDEAALIDGCSTFGLFWRIILPLSLPILAAVFILDFVSTWNEFAIALVILNTGDTWTIPLGMMAFRGTFSSNYGALNASIIISILPVIIVYLIFQRYFVTGLTAGAVKG